MGPTRHIFAGPLAALLVALLAFPGAAPAQAPQARARAQDAATQHRSERTEQANRDAAVADEASTPAPASRPSYGPVLAPRGQQGADAVRKDPAEVSDETDTLAREAAPQPHNQQLIDSRGEKLSGKELEEQRRRAARRHHAWQPEGPIAPRPLRAGESPPATAAAASAAAATAAVPIPPPLAAPQPTVPSSSVIRACQGSVCTDAAGNTFNGAGNAGVSSGGRLCARSGVTVQCF
jgi:hypothetical protein